MNTHKNNIRIMNNNLSLPSEWDKQSYIQLTWPHINTDWAYMLEEVEKCFVNLATEIASRQPLLLVAPEFPEALKDFHIKRISRSFSARLTTLGQETTHSLH